MLASLLDESPSQERKNASRLLLASVRGLLIVAVRPPASISSRIGLKVGSSLMRHNRSSSWSFCAGLARLSSIPVMDGSCMNALPRHSAIVNCHKLRILHRLFSWLNSTAVYQTEVFCFRAMKSLLKLLNHLVKCRSSTICSANSFCYGPRHPHAKCNAVLPSESSSSLSAPAACTFFKPSFHPHFLYPLAWKYQPT